MKKQKVNKKPVATAIRHTKPPRKPEFGFGDDALREQRETVYGRMFGENCSVSHEFLVMTPHIDVYIHRPRASRSFCTLVTGGMSDARMKVPRSEPKARKRAELIFYAAKPREEYINLLRFLARIPYEYDTWLGTWHTIPNGDPPEPLVGRKFTALLLLEPPMNPERQLPRRLRIESDPVAFLWVVPLTTPEYNYCLEQGVGKLLRVFKQHKHPHLFEPNRLSYV